MDNPMDKSTRMDDSTRMDNHTSMENPTRMEEVAFLSNICTKYVCISILMYTAPAHDKHLTLQEML